MPGIVFQVQVLVINPEFDRQILAIFIQYWANIGPYIISHEE